MPATLAHEVLTARDARPTRTMLFLHGILGSGANWRSHARRFVSARPDWAAALVDLRLHGDSLDATPPHNLPACVEDLDALPLDVPIAGVVGHSFGGKVALAYAGAHPLDELWVIDSTPSARPDRRGSEDVLAVLAMLREVPREHTERQGFVDAIRERGFSETLARWLATSLHRSSEGWRYPIDLDAIEAMLDDYFARDLWDVVPRASSRTCLVVGGKSNVLDEADRTRLSALAEAHAPVRLEVFEDAGHWLHVEEPDRLAALFAADGAA